MSEEDTAEKDGTIRVGGAVARRVAPARRERGGSIPVRVAVSGGIGAGKSTFSAALRPFALAFADADEVARQVVAPGSEGLELIRQRFGDTVVHADGTLNRAALAGIIFSDDSARADVERITHPRIADIVRDTLDVHGGGFTVYDIPLLLSVQDAAEYDEVIIVTAPLEDRLRRLEDRGLTREDAQRRVHSQISDEQRRSFATIIVENTGSSADLAEIGRRIAQNWLGLIFQSPTGLPTAEAHP